MQHMKDDFVPAIDEPYTVQELITKLLQYPQDAVILITSESADLLMPMQNVMCEQMFGDLVDLDFNEMFPNGAVIFQPGDVDLLDLG